MSAAYVLSFLSKQVQRGGMVKINSNQASSGLISFRQDIKFEYKLFDLLIYLPLLPSFITLQTFLQIWIQCLFA